MFVAGAAFAMTSCHSAKEKEPLTILNGEWNIVKVKGAPVKVASNQEEPFIGFDTTTGQVYGFSGCNRLMASFDLTTEPGKLDIGSIGSTRMSCPDLTLEHSIIAALDEVDEFKKGKDDRIELCDDDKVMLVLEKRPP